MVLETYVTSQVGGGTRGRHVSWTHGESLHRQLYILLLCANCIRVNYHFVINCPNKALLLNTYFLLNILIILYTYIRVLFSFCIL